MKIAQAFGAKGLATISLGTSTGSLNDLTMEMVKSVVAKFLTLEQIKQMAERLGANMGDLLLIIAGEPKVVSTVLAELRQEMGRQIAPGQHGYHREPRCAGRHCRIDTQQNHVEDEAD